jgi:hypothetical protein
MRRQIQEKAQGYSGFGFKAPNTNSEIGTTVSRARARGTSRTKLDGRRERNWSLSHRRLIGTASNPYPVRAPSFSATWSANSRCSTSEDPGSR